jgi:hypothetical protein
LKSRRAYRIRAGVIQDVDYRHDVVREVAVVANPDHEVGACLALVGRCGVG